jgi:hypothetical protein
VPFLSEVVRDFFAVLVTVVGLQAVGVAFAVGMDSWGDGLFYFIIAMGVMLLFAAGALYAIGFMSVIAFGPIAAGWLGMFTGRCPHGYGPEGGNGTRLVGALVIAAGSAWWGLGVWQRSLESGEHFSTVAGLLVVVTGVMIGLASAVPRAYFLRRPRPPEPPPSDPKADEKRAKRRKSRSSRDPLPTLIESVQDELPLFAMVAALGLGLANCSQRLLADTDGEPEFRLPYGDITTPCLDRDPDEDGCVETVRIELVPPRDWGRRVKIRTFTSCPAITIEDQDGEPVEVLSKEALEALGIGGDGYGYVVFDTERGNTYTVVAHAREEGSCSLGLRYVFAASEDS